MEKVLSWYTGTYRKVNTFQTYFVWFEILIRVVGECPKIFFITLNRGN